MLPPSLAPLAAYTQFVGWRLEYRPHPQTGELVPVKVPYSPKHRGGASSSNPADWGTYAEAAALPNMTGVGFVFSASDPFFFIDIDKAYQNGQWSQLAQDLCQTFAGAAVEVSQSGTGLHIIGRGVPPADHRNKNIPLGIELYTRERFVALTGINATGSADLDFSPQLGAVAAYYFPPNLHKRADTWSTEPRPEWSGPEDDAALIALALRSGGTSAEAAFGGAQTKTSFADLWNANAEVLGARWPGSIGQGFDASSADQALANQLAFWAGGNCERMERLMRQSALTRPKWDDRPDYLETTILKAVGMVTGSYSAPAPKEAPPPPPPVEPEAARELGFKIRDGGTMFAQDQMNHFAGCVYVSGPHRVLSRKGQKLDKGRFDALFGGHAFITTTDGKSTSTSAWEAFLENQAYIAPTADRFCFRPEHGTGGIIEEAGMVLANTYIQIDTPQTEGDPSPYLGLVARQLPDPRDQAIFLSYLASCLQNPGRKAQWWPVLQGTEGNGKTLHLAAITHAIGSQYCHLPNAAKMVRGGSNFNGWVEGKLFLGLEEVYAPDRRAFFEEFKTTVTNPSIPIEGKGLEEVTGDNRANGIIFTNHQEGVPISQDGRRYCPLFTAQQNPEDLIRDGMTPAYFADLYDWAWGREAYAHLGPNYGLRVINWYLRQMTISAELDPARLATRAPISSSTQVAIAAGRGRVEQEILEAIEEGRPGFAGGWVSSIKLQEFFDKLKTNIPQSKRRQLLKSLGYDWHPALAASNGRVNSIVQPDNGKPRLFCKIGSISWNELHDAPSVSAAYSKAQSAALTEALTATFGS